MDLKQRRIFYITLISLFALLAPFLILYAAGYNLAFFQRKIIKTGLLVINSYPRNSDIYLDDIITKKRTPINISNLIPKEYNIEIKKAGYYSWQKNLTVLPNTSIFADEISLFKINPVKESYFSGNIIISETDQDKQRMAILTGEKAKKSIVVIDLNNKTKKIIKENIDFEVKDINWHENNLIVEKENNGGSDYIILNTYSPEETLLSGITIQNFEKIIGHSNGFIYGLSVDTVYKIDLENKKIEAISKHPINDIIINKNNLLLISLTEGGTNLIKVENGISEIIENFDGLYHDFINLTDNYFLMKNENKFIFYTLNEEENSVFIETQITSAEIAPKKDKILYYNDNELWFYDIKEEKTHLINRQSGTIKEACWYPINEYIIYNLDNVIKATEIDLRDKRNEYNLYSETESIKIHKIFKSKYIILETKKEQNDELFSLKIQ